MLKLCYNQIKPKRKEESPATLFFVFSRRISHTNIEGRTMKQRNRGLPRGAGRCLGKRRARGVKPGQKFRLKIGSGFSFLEAAVRVVKNLGRGDLRVSILEILHRGQHAPPHPRGAELKALSHQLFFPRRQSVGN